MKLRAAIESLMASGQGLHWGRTYLEAALQLDDFSYHSKYSQYLDTLA
jgi:hypothetical protein